MEENEIKKKTRGCFPLGCSCLMVILSGIFLLIAAACLIITYYPNEDNETPSASDQKAAIIEINGIITSGIRYSVSGQYCSSDQIVRMLDRVSRDNTVKAIIISLNTPGGEVNASDDIHAKILEVREKTKKPVIAQMNAMAASGGYYVAVACDKIIAGRMTMTGSIGVIMSTYNYSGLISKLFIEHEVYKSGPMKDMLNGARKRTLEERKLAQEMVMETYGEFVRVVCAGRNLPESAIRNTELGDGRVFSGAYALKHKMVDQIGRLSDAVELAEKMAKMPKGSLKPARLRCSFSVLDFLMESKFGAKTIQINLNGSNSFMLRSGVPYFLPSEF